MKINYDVRPNYLKRYNEFQGLIMNRNKILKEKKFKNMGYLQRMILSSILSYILILITSCCVPSEFLSLVLNYFLLFLFFTFLYGIIGFLNLYKIDSSKALEGVLTIDENGLTNERKTGDKFYFPWNDIQKIVVGKYGTYVITNYFVGFILNKEESDLIKKALEKYNQESLWMIL